MKSKEKKSKIGVCTSIILVYNNKHDQNHFIIIFLSMTNQMVESILWNIFFINWKTRA